MAALSSIIRDGSAQDARAVVAGALAWWDEAGITEPLGDTARAWLDRPAPTRWPAGSTAPTPSDDDDGRPARRARPSAPTPALPHPSVATLDVPNELGAFREWLASAPLPGLAQGGHRQVGDGAAAADLALVIARPTARDTMLDGPHRRLLTAMLTAAGVPHAGVALIPVVPSHVGPHPSGDVADAFRPIVVRHLALVGARRALLLGDGPSLALLGQPASALRGRWHDVKHDGATVRAMASFDLDTLLAQPLCKPLAWADLLAFTEGLS